MTTAWRLYSATVAVAIFAHRHAVAFLEEALCIADRVEPAGRDDFSNRNVGEMQKALHFVESAIENCFKNGFPRRLAVPQICQALGCTKIGGDIGGGYSLCRILPDERLGTIDELRYWRYWLSRLTLYDLMV